MWIHCIRNMIAETSRPTFLFHWLTLSWVKYFGHSRKGLPKQHTNVIENSHTLNYNALISGNFHRNENSLFLCFCPITKYGLWDMEQMICYPVRVTLSQCHDWCISASSGSLIGFNHIYVLPQSYSFENSLDIQFTAQHQKAELT